MDSRRIRDDRIESATAETIAARYRSIRQATESLCEPLEVEDFCIQSIPDVSPTKWHLAHTSWFFETFVLKGNLGDYETPNPQYDYLFNSYYNAIGAQYSRPKRGLLSRPTVAEVYAYRKHVDGGILRLLETISEPKLSDLVPILELGLQHEQQHQELLLTDLKHVFSINPLRPVYRHRTDSDDPDRIPLEFAEFAEGIVEIGADGDRFCFDNELPRHRVLTHSFTLGSRLVTNGEYRAFIEDGGYRRPDLWLSDGWNKVRESGWRAPLYWEEHDGVWWAMTLSGFSPIVDAQPVCHVSYYEADAYARWADARLPTEFEWERVARNVPIEGNLVETRRLHPAAASAGARDGGCKQLFGDVWEWTGSAYLAYPGFRPNPGAVGEYNGKFMCGQFVLRGGSCVTPESHVRASYRNFFPPDARWQFTGIRLARDV
jgi:ergothioneine biosynthesis protein EgtB